MKELKINKHKVVIFDSIEDLPVVRYHKFSKLMLIDAHIGSTITDFDGHLEKILRYINSGEKELAGKELLNMRQNVYMIQSEISPRFMAFAALVHSIDGKVVEDLSDESLKNISTLLGGEAFNKLNDITEDCKKKLDVELQTYFSDLFGSSSIKEYYDILKKRTLLMLKKLEQGTLSEEDERELDRITDSLVLYVKPESFTGASSLEIQQDKQFENVCLAISQHINSNAKKFTVLEYYNALSYLKDQAKKQKHKAK